MPSYTTEAAATPGAALRLPLLVVATAQLMLVLDDTIANIALPSIQRQFGVSSAVLPWIVNAYVLAFGSLLLFGGRLGDLFGRRRVLRLGLALFTIASLAGGLGVNADMLITARGLQGIGAALVAPNVLALIATTFPMGKERNSAMAVYAAMSAVGMTIGVLLGGVLTGLLSWRWVFLINVPIGVAVLLGTRVLHEGERNTGSLNTIDAITGSGALFALAYGVTHGGEHGWLEAVTLSSFGVALALGIAFFLLQSRRAQPMLPLALLRNRDRAGSYLAVLFIGGGLMATYYLLTLYMQQVLQFSPVWAGVASLPVSVGIVMSAGISTQLVERFPARSVVIPGLLIAAGGMLWLSALSPTSSYVWHVLPALFVTYFGLGMGFMPLTLTAVHGVGQEQAGVASAILNTSQQIGAALGVSLLATIASSAANNQLPSAALALGEATARGDASLVARAAEALTAGFTTAFLAGGAMLLLALVVVATLVTTRRTQRAAA
jgi:EmrB/QacA subfamily drug resistance transporter